MGDDLTGPDQLELAVSGLSGLVGALLMPALGSWLRVLLQWIESDRSGLGRQARVSGSRVLWAVGSTFTVLFFSAALARAAGELRQVRVEAPILASILTGVFVGIALWATYAVGVSTLTADYRRAKQTRRIR